MKQRHFLCHCSGYRGSHLPLILLNWGYTVIQYDYLYIMLFCTVKLLNCSYELVAVFFFFKNCVHGDVCVFGGGGGGGGVRG